MAGYGTGVPNWFHCPVARRNQVWDGSYERDGRRAYRIPPGHNVVRTGRTKPKPFTGKQHPRMLDTYHEYRCQCGHVGWTAQRDILTRPTMVEYQGNSAHITTPSGRTYYACIGEVVTICKRCMGEGHFDSCFDCGNRGYFVESKA